LDLRNAIEFKENLEFSLKELTEFKSREIVSLKVKPINEWFLEAKENKLKLIVESKQLNERKEFLSEFNAIEFEEKNVKISEATEIELFLDNEKVFIQEKPLK
jgi:hypothetical protein